MVPGLEQGLLHKVVGTFLVAAQRDRERAQTTDFCYELISQTGGHFAPQLFVSASLKILKQSQEMLRYGLTRDLIEHCADMTADVSLQGRGQTAVGFRSFRRSRALRRALIRLVAEACHFLSAILCLRVASHSDPQYALLSAPKIPDSPSLGRQKRPRRSIGSIFWEPGFRRAR
jgi:hypothetical protein